MQNIFASLVYKFDPLMRENSKKKFKNKELLLKITFSSTSDVVASVSGPLDDLLFKLNIQSWSLVHVEYGLRCGAGSRNIRRLTEITTLKIKIVFHVSFSKISKELSSQTFVLLLPLTLRYKKTNKKYNIEYRNKFFFTSRVYSGRVYSEGCSRGEDRVGGALLPPLVGGDGVAGGRGPAHHGHPAALQHVGGLGGDEGRSWRQRTCYLYILDLVI